MRILITGPSTTNRQKTEDMVKTLYPTAEVVFEDYEAKVNKLTGLTYDVVFLEESLKILS